MPDKSTEYDVGYKKPPAATRFQAGQSGNPCGRPKGAQNFDIVLSKELSAQVEITEYGRRRKISKREAIAKQMVNKAASGDPKFVPMALTEARRVEGKNETPVVGAYMMMGQEDNQVAASIIARLKQRLSAEEKPNAEESHAQS